MQTETRDLAAFRRRYDLPTAQDYLRLLSSADQQEMGQIIAAREQAAVARLREEGFRGSTLAEAYDWWLRDGETCDAHECGHGACSCH